MFESSLSFLMTHINKIPYHVNNHTHNCYELVYYITGSGKSIIDNMEYEYTPNTFVIIPPKTNHSEIAEEETKIIYIGFNYNNKPEPIGAMLINDTQNHTIYKLLSRLKTEMSSRKTFYNYYLTILVDEIIIALFRILNQLPKENENTDKLEYIINYIQTNYHNDINLQELAELTGYSYDRFRHIFKEQTGVSPKQYILTQRLKNACAMLCNSDTKIASIAQDCGFTDVSQFITCFNKTFNLTPMQYRRQSGIYKEEADYMGKSWDYYCKEN